MKRTSSGTPIIHICNGRGYDTLAPISMTKDSFRTDELDAWWRYYNRLDEGGPYHEPAYLNILENHYGVADQTAELFVYEQGEDFVYYPYLIRSVSTVPFAEATSVDTSRYSDITASWYYGGPIATHGGDKSLLTGFRQAFEEHCRETGIIAEFVRYDPNLENHQLFDFMNSEFNRETIPVDLTKSKEALWDGFEKRNRNAIRQAQDSDLVVEPTGEPHDIRDFHEIYSNAMDARDAAAHYRFDVEFFHELLADPNRATLLVARHGELVVGGSLVVHDDQTAHDYIRASNPDYWDQRVNNLLCYEALMHMRDRGRYLFDFQGGRPGVFRFKKGFSPDRREFHIGKEIHLEGVYERLVDDAAAAGIDPDKAYFPAYRREHSN